MFTSDVELPADFEPKTDGSEIETFYCLPAEEVYYRIKNTEDFKYNSALVMIDFLIRKGIITQNEPELYRNLQFGC